jgi:hypothetical protein
MLAKEGLPGISYQTFLEYHILAKQLLAKARFSGISYVGNSKPFLAYHMLAITSLSWHTYHMLATASWIRVGSGFNGVPGSVSGSKREKMTHKHRKKVHKFHF